MLGELVKEDPGVCVREYNFAVSAQTPEFPRQPFPLARSSGPVGVAQ